MDVVCDIAPIEAMLYALAGESSMEHHRLKAGERLWSRLEVGFLREEGKTLREIGKITGRSNTRVGRMLWELSRIYVPFDAGSDSGPRFPELQIRRVRRLRRYIRSWSHA